MKILRKNTFSENVFVINEILIHENFTYYVPNLIAKHGNQFSKIFKIYYENYCDLSKYNLNLCILYLNLILKIDFRDNEKGEER